MWKARPSRCSPTSPGDSDTGTALPAALVLLACLVGVTGWLAGHVRVDQDLARTLEDEQDAGRLAESAAQVVALSLAQVADWTRVDALVVPLPCVASSRPGIALDAVVEGRLLQASEDAASRWGGETPRWTLAWVCHAPGVLGYWPPAGLVPSVAVWIADDVEGDGDVARDRNQRLRVAAVAAGPGQTRASVQATVGRSASGAPVTLLAWRPAGQG